MGRGYPLPSRLGDLGERRISSSSGVRGRAPAETGFLVHFELDKTNLVMTNLLFFVSFIKLFFLMRLLNCLYKLGQCLK